jgi:hypothetical protein
MNSNEDDYESNIFIDQAKQLDEKNSYLKKKKNREERGYNKPHEVIMFEKLNQGLSKPIERGNKGHKLLLKMGYKEGTSLGRNGGGITQPIDLIKHTPLLREKIDKHCKEDERYNNLLDSKMSIYCEINNKMKKIFHQKESIVRNLCLLTNLYFQRNSIKERFKETIDLTEYEDEAKGSSFDHYYNPKLQKCITKLTVLNEVLSSTCNECLNICNCQQVYNNYQIFLEVKELFEFNIAKFFRELIRSAIDNKKIEECHDTIETFYNTLHLSNNEIKNYIRNNYLYCTICAEDFTSEAEFNEHIEACEINI